MHKKARCYLSKYLKRPWASCYAGKGLCHACGNVQGGCEPDAREYTCEKCRHNTVYGLQETMLMTIERSIFLGTM